jgi:two-component system, NarL family, response regulator LiaR
VRQDDAQRHGGMSLDRAPDASSRWLAKPGLSSSVPEGRGRTALGATGGEGRLPSPRRPRVVLAGPDVRFRSAVRGELAASGFTIVAEAGHDRETSELVRFYEPDLLVEEVVPPAAGTMSTIRQWSAEGLEVLVLLITPESDAEIALAALRAGAVGVLEKDLRAGVLSRVLGGVLAGEAVVPRWLSMSLVESLRRMPEHGWRPVRSQLTTREWEIIDLLDAGASTRDIADHLFLSTATVYSHVKNIRRKLDVRSRAEAVRAAHQLRPTEVSSGAGNRYVGTH